MRPRRRTDVAAPAEESSAPSSGRAGPVAGWRVPSSRALNVAEERGRHAACPPALPAARPTSPLLTRPQAAGPRRGRRWCRSSGTSGHGRQRWSGGLGVPSPSSVRRHPSGPWGRQGRRAQRPGARCGRGSPWSGRGLPRTPPCGRVTRVSVLLPAADVWAASRRHGARSPGPRGPQPDLPVHREAGALRSLRPPPGRAPGPRPARRSETGSGTEWGPAERRPLAAGPSVSQTLHWPGPRVSRPWELDVLG